MERRLIIFTLDLLAGKPAEGLRGTVNFPDDQAVGSNVAHLRSGADGCLRMELPEQATRCHAVLDIRAYQAGQGKGCLFSEIILDVAATPGDETVICTLFSGHAYTVYRGFS